MRILLFDYSGHPFQVQLSRELARRGHEVTHSFSSVFQTPKGNLVRQPGDPAGFSTAPIATAKPFAKHSFVRRRRQEIEIGRRLAALIASLKPDVVISSNAPLDVQKIAQRATRRAGAGFVFWLQDIYSHAIADVLPAKVPVLGHVAAYAYTALEFRLLRRSDAVVAITADFEPLLIARRVASARIHTIENWAPLEDIAPMPRDNPWAQAHMSPAALRIVYSGTVGYKHNPALLLALARRLPQAHVHVFSEGPIVEELARQARAEGIANFGVAPWVPFADLPAMLGGADIVVALIEPEAGIYSVPSKVLTYLAVGRPILASVPKVNLAARLIDRIGAGLVAEPRDEAGFLAAAQTLGGDAGMRERMGAAGRAHALVAFDVGRIADRFEAILAPLARGKAAR